MIAVLPLWLLTFLVWMRIFPDSVLELRHQSIRPDPVPEGLGIGIGPGYIGGVDQARENPNYRVDVTSAPVVHLPGGGASIRGQRSGREETLQAHATVQASSEHEEEATHHQQEQSGPSIHHARPKSVNDLPPYVDTLLAGNIVLVAFLDEELSAMEINLILQFMYGAIYTMGGLGKKISNEIYVFTPRNVKFEDNRMGIYTARDNLERSR